MKFTEKQAYLALSSLAVLLPRRVHALISKFESAANLWHTPVESWDLSRLSQRVKNHIQDAQRNFNPITYIEQLKELNINVITYVEEQYPKRLLNLHDPPLAIYYKGNLKICDENNYLAVVGSRKRKIYGQKAVKMLLPSLIKQGLIIVSGMAYGIDSDAHLCAIENNGYNIAVLGSGLNHKITSGNHSLVNKILNNGALVSEYPPFFEAKKWTFPARNRIIAALSDAVLVVEAGKKSGSLITADFASQLGKEIYSVPGSILSHTNIGTNMLIKNGAKPILTVEDLAEEFTTLKIVKENKVEINLNNKVERDIYNLLDNEPISIDEIVKNIDAKTADIQSSLTILSIRGLIEESAGRLFSRKK